MIYQLAIQSDIPTNPFSPLNSERMLGFAELSWGQGNYDVVVWSGSEIIIIGMACPRTLGKFCPTVTMKYRPEVPSQTRPAVQGILQKFKSLFQTIIPPKAEAAKQAHQPLKFIEKMSEDSFILGNSYQLDFISISILKGEIQTDILWTLSETEPILKVAVSPKRTFLLVSTCQKMILYKNDAKSRKRPSICSRLKTLPQHIHTVIFLKQTLISVFYKSSFIIYHIEDWNATRVISNSPYNVPANLQLFQVPFPIDNVYNIFFKETNGNEGDTSCLWRRPFYVQDNIFKFDKLVRIHELFEDNFNSMSIKYCSKDLFFINFNHEIMVSKDGYIVDTAAVNIKQPDSHIVYFENKQSNNLLHILKDRLEVYTFQLLTNCNPNKIKLETTDSISLSHDSDCHYFGCLDMLNDNYLLVWQPKKSQYGNGELQYNFSVTQQIPIQEKIKEIFNFKSGIQLQEKTTPQNFKIIAEKCDAAFKMGLTRKEIFLQLWNISNKESIEDFRFLLDTMDFETIRREVQKKLKKHSLSFTQLFKIENYCCQMLRVQVESQTECTEEALKNYLSSHFFLTKLGVIRQMHPLKNPNVETDSHGNKNKEAPKIKINFKQYTKYLEMELTQRLLELLYAYCFNNDGEKYLLEARVMIKTFRFQLRVEYTNFLEKLICLVKEKLEYLLQAMPELLPAKSIGIENKDGLENGIWGEITKTEWSSSLQLETVTTIYNKEVVDKVVGSLWFKRNRYTQHGLVNLSRQQIIKRHSFNQSSEIFYVFIAKIFEVITDYNKKKDVVQQLERICPQLPVHLKGRIFLYWRLYEYLLDKYGKQLMFQEFLKLNKSLFVEGDKQLRFQEFLKLEDHEVFKMLFECEKISMGCLLHEAKNIFQDEGSSQAYKEGLLHYFRSDISKISDVKYILNRLNNEKIKFHEENEDLFKVLLDGLEMKIYIGGQDDIPLGEVLIYMDNISLPKDNAILAELDVLHEIDGQYEKFKNLNLNQSLYWIIHNCDAVIIKLVNQEIILRKIFEELRTEADFIFMSCQLLASVESIREAIYGDIYKPLSYFHYITRLMERDNTFHLAVLLLENEDLRNGCDFTPELIQNLIIYMYKWKMHSSKSFPESQDYIRKLIPLLKPESATRKFIEAELQFGLMLSPPFQPLLYPINNQQELTFESIKDIIFKLPFEWMINLNFDLLRSFTVALQELTKANNSTITNSITTNNITITELYEIVISRLLFARKVNEAIPFIKKLIAVNKHEMVKHESVYCLLICEHLACELPQLKKEKFIEKIYHSYKHPQQLLKIIEKLMNKNSITEEKKENLPRKQAGPIYSPNSSLLAQEAVKVLNRQKSSDQQIVIMSLGKSMLTASNDKSLDSLFMFIMILNDPYAFVKYIYLKHSIFTVRKLLIFINQLTSKSLFKSRNVLQFARRGFYIVLCALIDESTSINALIEQFMKDSLEEEKILGDPDIENTVDEFKFLKLIRCIQRKIKMLNPQEENIRESSHISPDSDEEGPSNIEQMVKPSIRQKQREVCNFNAMKSRKLIFDRQNESLRQSTNVPSLFMNSDRFQDALSKSNLSKSNLGVIRKTSTYDQKLENNTNQKQIMNEGSSEKRQGHNLKEAEKEKQNKSNSAELLGIKEEEQSPAVESHSSSFVDPGAGFLKQGSRAMIRKRSEEQKDESQLEMESNHQDKSVSSLSNNEKSKTEVLTKKKIAAASDEQFRLKMLANDPKCILAESVNFPGKVDIVTQQDNQASATNISLVMSVVFGIQSEKQKAPPESEIHRLLATIKGGRRKDQPLIKPKAENESKFSSEGREVREVRGRKRSFDFNSDPSRTPIISPIPMVNQIPTASQIPFLDQKQALQLLRNEKQQEEEKSVIMLNISSMSANQSNQSINKETKNTPTPAVNVKSETKPKPPPINTQISPKQFNKRNSQINFASGIVKPQSGEITPKDWNNSQKVFSPREILPNQKYGAAKQQKGSTNSKMSQYGGSPKNAWMPEINQEDRKKSSTGRTANHCDEVRSSIYFINVNEVHENEYMPPRSMRVILLEEYEDTEKPINLVPLEEQIAKQAGDASSYLKTLIIEMYAYEDKPLGLILSAIRQICEAFNLEFNKQFFDIYCRFESYDSKYNMGLPIRQLLPICSMFFRSGNVSDLFQCLCPNIISSVDDTNAIKVFKTVHLAFCVSQYEDKLIYLYLCQTFKKMSRIDEAELQMHLARLGKLIEKVQVHTLFEKGVEMLRNISNEQIKRKVMESMCAAFKLKQKDSWIVQFRQKVAAM